MTQEDNYAKSNVQQFLYGPDINCINDNEDTGVG